MTSTTQEVTGEQWADLLGGAVLQADAREGQPPFWYRPPMFPSYTSEREFYDQRERVGEYIPHRPWWTKYEHEHDGPINPVSAGPRAVQAQEG